VPFPSLSALKMAKHLTLQSAVESSFLHLLKVKLDQIFVLYEVNAQDQVLRVKAACGHGIVAFQLQVVSLHHYEPSGTPLLRSCSASVTRPA